MAHRYFLAFHIFTSCLVAGKSPIYALVGLEVKLMADIPGHPDDMLWKHNGNKVVDFDGKEQHVYNPYENRITLNWISAQLDITDLRFEDSGDYELEVTMNNNLYTSNSLLEVIDKVSKPSISCEMDSGNSSDISAQLVCSAEPAARPQSLLKFEWRSHGSVRLGRQLTIPLGEKLDEEVYNCTVSNPLSSETATFAAKDCYPDKSSSVALAVTLITILLFILLLVVFVLVFYKRIRKACFAEGKTDDLEAQSPPDTTKESDTKAAQDDENRPLLSRGGNVRPFVTAGTHEEEMDSDLDIMKDEETVTEADEEEEAPSAPANAETSPTAQPRSPLTKSSVNVAPKDAAGEHEEESDSDQVGGETAEETVRASVSSGIHQSRGESDVSSEEEQSSSVSEQKASETSVHEKDSGSSQGESGEENQQESDNTVSDRVGDSEEIHKEQNQPQSPTPTKPHDRNTSTFQEPPEPAQADPHQEDQA